jgi:hypothetical protein
MYLKLVNLVRVLLGIQLLINGLNWWVKLIDPYPSIADFAGGVWPANITGFMRGMIETNLIFHLVKATEVVSGLLLLTDTLVPFALVFGYPVAVIAMIVDVFISTRLRAFIMGSGIFFNTTFLMLAYFSYYRSMLMPLSRPDDLGQWEWERGTGNSAYAWVRSPPINRLKLAMATLALLYALVMVTWLVVMIIQHFTR